MLLAGGVAGIATWLVPYPFDVLCSQIRTMPLRTPPAQLRMMTVSREGLAREGYRFFTRGLSTTLIRSVPVNAVALFVYEDTLAWLNRVG